MLQHRATPHSVNLKRIPVIDLDFDQFDFNSDLEMQLREADSANFYNGALDLTE